MDLDTKVKLKTKLYIKQLARKNIDIVYKTLDTWEKNRRKIAKKKENTTLIDYKIDELNKELERLEENME